MRMLCRTTLSSFAFITIALAADLKPTPAEFLIPRLEIKVDGKLDEWSLDKTGYAIDPAQAGKDPAITLHASDPDNPIKGAGDVSARVGLAWDDKHLYIAATVTDNDLRGIKPGSPHNVGPPGWKCDSVMVQIHSFRQAMRTNSPYTSSPNIALRYEVPADGRGKLLDNKRKVLDRADAYWKLPEGSTLASRETPTGYEVEAAVPWSALDYRPQAGEVLFCSFLLGDMDAGEALNQLGWHFGGKGAEKERAVFRLLGQPEATGLLSLSRNPVEPKKRWSVQYRVDARGSDVKVETLVLVGEEGEALSLPIGVDVPKGRTASDVIVIDATPGKPGKYEMRLLVSIGGRTSVLVKENVELLPGPPPAPIIANPPGEVHHMRPDRVPHSAFEDHRRGILRHGFVTDRSGYERYILTHVKDYIDRNMEDYIKRKSPNMAGMTLKSYTLWKLTGDDKYCDLTRRGLEVAIENHKRKTDIHRLLLLIEPRYWIWQHDPKTPAAPPNIEQDFAMIWAKVATEHNESWMFQEWGYHNRCWHRLGVMKIAKHFAEKLGMPVSPRIEEYIAWHQPRYDRFGACTDNSSGYHWVGFRYPVYWNMIMDTLPELAEHKGWVEALGRWRQYSSPSGAVPNFGDTSGWSAGAWEAMASFELMGTLTKDGRFRWQAHRIAEWLYNHFWPRHDQYHLPRDRVGLNFCRAWLRADDSIKPVAPSAKSRITFRTKCVEPTEEDKAARPGWSGLKLVEEKIPAKLILTSGNNPQALWAFVELVAVGGHCGHLPGHIAGLLQHDAALLAGQGYYERSGNFNNILWIEDREGLAVDPRPMQTEVPIFVEDRDVTRVRIRARPFQQMPVTVERDIVFVKNAFVLVKDRATFHATMNIRVGPCWQARDLGPQCSDDWFNAYYEHIYYTGLGLGKGVHAYRNPAWDLLVRFAPRADTRITVQDRYEDNPFRTSPTMLRQSWAGIAKVGDVKTFTTILLPHGPAFDVTPYADWAQFVVDNDKTTLVHVRTEVDNMHHFQETHWVLLQEEPGMVEAKRFRSDAAFALVSTDRKGKLKGAVMVGGTILEVDGKDLAAGARKPKAESIFEIEK